MAFASPLEFKWQLVVLLSNFDVERRRGNEIVVKG